MKHIWVVAFLLCMFISSVQTVAANTVPPMVLRWAPIIYQQHKNETSMSQENVFAEVNFDHDWRSNNNSSNLAYYPPDMAAYYSLVESSSHYFIGYYFYYPRYLGGNEHDNDMTGILVAARKTPDGAGHLDMLLTYNDTKLRKWDVADMQTKGVHLNVSLGAGTHKITVMKATKDTLLTGAIRPMPSQSVAPGAVSRVGQNKSHAGYRLVALDQLWERRQDIGQGRTFSRWGYFDSYNDLKVSAPWVWEYQKINWLSSPAELMKYYQGSSAGPVMYLNNSYQSAKSHM